MAKKKIRVDRLFMLIFIVLMIVSLLGFGGYLISNYFNNLHDDNNNHNDPNTNNDVVVETEKITIKLNDYTVYVDDNNELSFNFVVANVDIDTNKDKLVFDLANLQTSEKKLLNNVDKQKNKVTSCGYDISRLDLSENIIKSDNNHANVNLFIPYDNDINILKIFNLLDTNKFDIDLDVNNTLITSLKLSSGESIEIDEDLKIFVKDSMITTQMYHYDEEYPCPDTLPVYVFVLEINEAKPGVYIEDAKFIKDGESEEHTCLDESYSSLKQENILKEELTPGLKAALFFQIETNDPYVSKDGTLLLKLSNSTNWIKITTELR